jgi:hypothetical protein
MSRPGKGRRIFKGLFLIAKWLWVALLAAALAAGLIFQAPWKVSTLLAILIVTPTIIPKRARKYIYLTFAIVLLSLAVWVFLPEEDTGWRPYTLDEEIAAYRIKYAVPDDQNAAAIYEELLQTYDGSRFVLPQLTEDQLNDPNAGRTFAKAFIEARPPNTFYPDFWNDELDDLTLFKPWSSAAYPELAAWLRDKHAATIDALMEASRRPFCRFEMTFDILDFPYDRNSAMKDWAGLLTRAANNHWGDNRMDDAVEKYTAAIRTAALYSEYPPNGVVMGVDLAQPLLRPLRSFIMNAPLTKEQLDQVDEALESIAFDWQASWPIYLEQETLELQNSFLGYIYEVNETGKVRSKRSTEDPVRQRFGIESAEKPYQRVLAKIAAVFDWFYIPRDPHEAAAAFGRAFDGLKPMGEPEYDWNRETSFTWKSLKLHFDHFAELLILESTYRKLHDLFLRTYAEERGARLLLALKSYQNSVHTLPADLAQVEGLVAPETLVDPITKDAYVYKQTGDTFTLYSKGKNGADDGGVSDHKTGADDVLIWPLKH